VFRAVSRRRNGARLCHCITPVLSPLSPLILILILIFIFVLSSSSSSSSSLISKASFGVRRRNRIYHCSKHLLGPRILQYLLYITSYYRLDFHCRLCSLLRLHTTKSPLTILTVFFFLRVDRVDQSILAGRSAPSYPRRPSASASASNSTKPPKC